jgi:phosphopantothenoylcysteine decarboxylase/phosphopantothenate--cysteine ligase
MADDILTSMLLAGTAPVLLAPAMNDEMFAHPATQQNLETLRERGWSVIGPAVGALAEGASDRPGRMSEAEEIVGAAERMIRGAQAPLAGKRVVVTAGPTREALDAVRVFTNRSSGRMGFAVAAAAHARGADVTLIAGPTPLPAPVGVDTIAVESTVDLQHAVADALPDTDVLIMAAAPADFRPAEQYEEKQPRGGGPLEITLAPTDDVLLGTRDARKAGAIVVGFALETSDGIERAQAKLERKGLDLIVLNMANEAGAGFEVETNRVTLVSPTDTVDLPAMPKRDVAERILDAVEHLL